MSTSQTTALLAFEGGGWFGFTAPGKRYGTRVHLSHKPGPGRWVVDEVRFSGFRVTARDLRDFPLGKVEIWVNNLAQRGLVDPAQAEPPDAVPFGDSRFGAAAWLDKLPPAPGKGAKPDGFYQRAAEIYARAALVSARPAAELAEAWDVPVTSVHRWVRVARARGYLPPGESGRRG